MKIFTWIIQILLSAMFIMAGFMKAFTPIEALAVNMPWVNDFSISTVRFIGAMEIIGGLGLLLPSLLRIKPVLTPLAGAGLALIMLFALIYHVGKGEFAALPVNIIMGGLSLFVAWARYKKVPVTVRS